MAFNTLADESQDAFTTNPPWNNVGGSVPYALYNENSSTRPSKHMVKQHTMMACVEDVQTDPDDNASGDMRFECSVCLGEYHESGNGVPRSLLCGHTFCTGCLNDLVKECAINCPKCHHITPISFHGVEISLVKNYGVLEIIYSHPSSYRARMSSPKSSLLSSSKGSSFSNSDQNQQIAFTADIPICNLHGDRMTSFCVKDKVLVCSSCLLYGTHKSHPCQLVKDASQEHKQRLQKLIPDIRNKNDDMRAAVVDVNRTVKRVQETSMSLAAEVDERFDGLIGTLEERRKELKVEILLRTQERVEALSQQIRSLEEAVVSADECYSEIKDLLASGNHEFLQKYSSMSKKILSLFAESVPTVPFAKDDLRVKFPPESVLEDFRGQFKNYGSIQSEVAVVEELLYDSYHDGFRIYWQNQDYVDSEGCTYSLQVATSPSNDYTFIYRGGTETKFTYKRDDLKSDATYKFRVRVQTPKAFGPWSAPVECQRAPPGWVWDKKRRNFKIDVSSDCLEVSSRYSSDKHWASVSGNRVFHHGVFYMEIEITDMAKHHIHKNRFTKIALGVIQCSDSSAHDIPWQDGTNYVGRLTTASYQGHNSWGYVATSAIKVSTTTGAREEDYGNFSTFVVGDRIGMLVEVNEQEPSSISFFCNGTNLGVAYSNLSPPLIPVLSVCDKFSIRLRFPPPPYSRRDPRLAQLTDSIGCP